MLKIVEEKQVHLSVGAQKEILKVLQFMLDSN